MGSFRTASARLESISAEDRKMLARFQKRFGPDVERVLLKMPKSSRPFAPPTPPSSATFLRRTSAKQSGRLWTASDRMAKRSQPSLSFTRRTKRRGVDLERLKTVQDRLYGHVARLLNGRNSFSSGNITVRALDAPFDWPPMVLPPDPDVGTLYVPPFGEPWERRAFNNASGDSRVTENRSYLDAEWGRIGSRLVAHNHDASDSDYINVYRQNGFIVPFTVPTTGVLQIGVDLICLLCRHHISTSDEWGWSDFHGLTGSTLVLSVFWDHDDGEPTSEDADQSLVPGLDSRGDGESYPGTVVQVDPGERRSVDFYTDVAFPAGKTVWVYVGIVDRIYALVNDVGIDISLDSAWQVSSLAVLSL